MKHLYFLGMLALMLACANEKELGGGQFASINIVMDTVIIDAGNEIINLRNGIITSTLSQDKKLLLNFDQQQAVINKIDLDQMVLVEKIPYEKEGPNGTGQYVTSVQTSSSDNLIISTWGEVAIFNSKVEKLEKFDIKEYQNFNADYLEDKNILIGLVRSWPQNGLELGVLDYQNNDFKIHNLKEFDKIQDFQVMLRSKNAVRISGMSAKVQEHQGKYLISSYMSNTLAQYDPVLDTISYLKYENKLTENSKTGRYRNVVETQEDFEKEVSSINQEISFQAPMWDENKGVFYRFSFRQLPTPADAEIDTPKSYEVFLTILDNDLKVLAESKIDALTKYPGSTFVKDGKIWIYENLDDELGFVRLKVETSI
ncbi:DUF4221 family protein [Litoribacter alkaliphilus]|uniref:DUF4221 family protein n=1 Tax=Litoribacter ruber TaxID=702568 RepID=A0AAP2CKI4_9BACT|nr:DUF4221 family protein [Litoribacter alkaliphilus]MBS9525625.1 DUF4221 family protein [Litoribacter alkaliphilus]